MNYLAYNKSSIDGSEQTRDLVCMKEFADTQRRIENFYKFETGHNMRMGNSWICKNVKGSSNELHLHGGSHISGVYYINVPENGGDVITDIGFVQNRAICFNGHIPHQSKLNYGEDDEMRLTLNGFFYD